MNEKKNSIFRAGLLVALLTILSKCIGFLREALIAAYFGTTAETDAFFLANSMPGLIFPSVCVSVSTAFIPLYIDRMTKQGKEEGDRYASRMLWATLLLSAFLSIIGVILAPVMVSLFAPGFSEMQQELASRLSRITMGAFSLTMLNYMVSAILNANRIFIRSQIAFMFYNVSIISLTLFGGVGQTVEFLTAAFIISSGVQTLALIIVCRNNFHCSLVNPFQIDAWYLLRHAIPILLGNSIVQINTIVDKILSSYLPEGSLSALNYGNTLTMIVTGVIILSLSTVLYPALTSCISQGKIDQFEKMLSKSLSTLSFILIPISVITVFTAEDIVILVYGRGSFGEQAIQATTIALSCYAPMFLAYGIREVLTKALYAFQDSKTPMINCSVGVCFNVAFSIILVQRIGIAGIALGTTLSAYISSILLSFSIRKKVKNLSFKKLYGHLLIQGGSGILLIGVLSRWCSGILSESPLLHFVFNTVIGLGVYGVTVLVLSKLFRISRSVQDHL